MSSVVFGTNVTLEANLNSVIASVGCASALAFTFENEIIAKTDRNAGLFRKKRVRMSDCRGSVTGLTTLVDTAEAWSTFQFFLESVRRAEIPLIFRFTDESGNSKEISGNFLIATIEVTGDASSFSEYSIEFEGTGDVIFSTPSSDSPSDPGECELQDTLIKTLAEDQYVLSVPEIGVANAEVLWVARDGVIYTPIFGGTPVNREVLVDYDAETLTWPSGNPALPPGVGVEIGWQITS